MNCRQSEKWMIQGRDSLTGDQRRVLEQHLAGCTNCRERDRALTALEAHLRDLQIPEPPASVRDSLWQDIRPFLQTRVSRSAESRRFRNRFFPVFRRPPLSWAIPAAAACSLVIWLTLFRGPGLPGDRAMDTDMDVIIEEASIGGRPADIAIFNVSDPKMTFVWLER